MMKSLRFFQVDVFTDTPLCGNPLAVFSDCEGLDSGTMQKIARETNLSETTFVFPPTDPQADFDVRIFTPSKEIPFAGHPSLGTADVLLKSGLAGSDAKKITFRMGVGNVAILRRDPFWFMEQPLPEFSEPLNDVTLLASVLSLAPDSIANLPIQVVSTGLPALLVPIANLDAMKQVALNLPELKKLLGPVDLIYLFTQETVQSDHDIHSRAFGPFIGIPEDPATGSVAGAMGCYLVKHGIKSTGNISQVCIEQGLEMERPSTIKVEIKSEAENIYEVRVGGQVVTVMQGELMI